MYRDDIAFIVGLFLQVWPIGWIVASLLKKWFPVLQNMQTVANVEGISKYIGLLERVIIFAFVWQGAYEATSFIIAGKALLRFREANEEHRSEYILVGTLLSSACAILSAMALHRVCELLFA